MSRKTLIDGLNHLGLSYLNTFHQYSAYFVDFNLILLAANEIVVILYNSVDR